MMGPPGPREEIQAAIAATGCVLRDDPIRGGLACVDCPSYRSRAELVDVLAWRDARYDGRIRQLATAIARGVRLDGDRIGEQARLCAAVQNAVASRVRYLGEAGDVIQDAWTTWETALGDCDCQARLVLALLRALGVPCDLIAFHRGESILHVCAAWRAPQGRSYLETTLGPAVQLGEHPYLAKLRLGANDRRDLA
jgi:transglutaminase-like putative cysteine protease